MADFDASLSGLISQYGTDNAKVKAGVDVEAKEDSKALTDTDVFMTLYIEQLKAQDPTAPQDTNKMVSQIAEMSSLEELSTISTQLESMTSALTSSQAISASTLVGQKIMANTNVATLDEGGDVPVKMNIPEVSLSTTLEIRNAEGDIVRDMSVHEESFVWDGKDNEGNALAAGEYNFKALSIDGEGVKTSLMTRLPAKIEGVTISGPNGTELNVSGVGKIGLTEELDIVG
ncbi:flagellar hook assembly protein FlgD [Marinomonas sp. PE14-40]|uniref:flagellar hook assembly protein FlgD n=1 Tax=Marinomonas sp. PE14-40 TaxID=3060621 RepID=UPI003F674C72